MVPINYWAVLVVAVINVILGSLWYGPIFGKMWLAEANMTPEKMEAGKKRMGIAYFITIIGALLMSYIFAHTYVFVSTYTGTSGISSGLSTAFITWLGFIAPVTIGSVLWEGKTVKYWLVNSLYYLIALGIAGIIFSLWK